MAMLKEWLNAPLVRHRALHLGFQHIKSVQAQSSALAPDSPFDPRTQVSADAKYIVRNLVFWFLVVPTVLGLVLWAVTR